MAKFINTELESESELESEAKLESKSEFSVLQNLTLNISTFLLTVIIF